MRICIIKATNRIIEMQSDCTSGTLLQNAVNMGYSPNDVEEKEVDVSGYLSALSIDPVVIASQQAQTSANALAQAKLQAINDNLPSRKEIKDAITGAWPAGAQRQIILKLADVVYWLAKGTEA